MTDDEAAARATQKDDVRHERTRGGASAIEKGAKGGGGGGCSSRETRPRRGAIRASGAIAAYDETLKLNPKDGARMRIRRSVIFARECLRWRWRMRATRSPCCRTADDGEQVEGAV